jgi:uncharacterized membrane protein YfhO
MKAQRDFEETSWIDFGDEIDEPLVALANGPGEVEATSAGTSYVLRTSLRAPSWVVLPVTHWKGWEALDGSRRLATAYANHAFLGIQVPAGDRVVTVRYRPRSWALGLRIAAASFALCLVIGAVQARQRARRRPV